MSQHELSVWFDSMPESNGKRNWTVMLHRKDQSMTDGMTIHRSEYYDQARYDADTLRFMIGEIEKEPFILDYDEKRKNPPEEDNLVNSLDEFLERVKTMTAEQIGDFFSDGVTKDFRNMTLASWASDEEDAEFTRTAMNALGERFNIESLKNY